MHFDRLTMLVLVLFACVYGTSIAIDVSSTTGDAKDGVELYKIEGTASLPREAIAKKNWRSLSRVLVNHGQYIGFISRNKTGISSRLDKTICTLSPCFREDGQFAVSGVPAGSYIVEISNVDFVFEPVRVDITSKGKMRARRLNVLQPSAVTQLPYPLKLVARQPANYFRPREEWRITDMLMNPMVLMMVVPLLLVVVLPKLINTSDPQLQRDMQQSMQMPKYEMPDLSDMMASWFGGGGPKKGTKKPAIGAAGGSGSKKRS